MKTANWESHKQSLEFQVSQPVALLFDQAHGLPKRQHLAIPSAFNTPAEWNTIQTCTPKPAKSVYDYYCRLQITFKESFGLVIDVEPSRVAFKSIFFINGLNRSISVSQENLHRMGNNAHLPDLVNLSNPVACTLEGDSKRRATKIFNFNKWNLPNKLSLLGSHYCERNWPLEKGLL